MSDPTTASVREPLPTGPRRITFDTYEATLERKEQPTPDLFELTYVLDKPITFTAGQYVSVFLPGYKHPVPLSIASSPVEHERLSLGIEIVGEGTKRMCEMRVGEKVTMKGPFGMFTMGTEPKVCFLAGGVGITPFLSMMRWIRDTGAEKDATLLYSVKDKAQFLWFDEISAMPTQHPGLHAVFTLTREAPPGWQHKTGRINDALIREAVPDLAETIFYCCGPPVFIDAMQKLVLGMGVPAQHFRREAWHSG